MQRLDEKAYRIFVGELGFILQIEPKPTVRGADLAVLPFVEEDQLGEGFVRAAPLLVVEVVSPSNSPEDIEKKRLQYVQAGTGEVWIVYNKPKSMHVSLHSHPFQIQVIRPEDTFDCSLGFTVDAKEIFR